MKKAEIISIMRECKEVIEDRCEESSPYFYDDIRNEEIEWMCEVYPDIDSLTADEFQSFWKQA